jgi:hypothetical protein
LIDWLEVHRKVMAALRERVEVWLQAYGQSHRKDVRIRFYEAFGCWLDARKAAAKVTGEEMPDPQDELRLILGMHAPEFALPDNEDKPPSWRERLSRWWREHGL